MDDFIARLLLVNGDVERDVAAAIGCCIVFYTRCLHIKASCTPSLLFKELPLPLSAEPSFTPGTDLALRLANDAILAPAAPSFAAGIHIVLFGLCSGHYIGLPRLDTVRNMDPSDNM